MIFHDPVRATEVLWNHLASHDQSLRFLFGSGTSAINVANNNDKSIPSKFVPLIPTVIQLTEKCKEAISELGDNFNSAWEKVIEECILSEIQPNIENILTRIRFKISAISLEDTSVGLNLDNLKLFEKTIRETITKLASVKETDIPNKLPHDIFSRWIKQATRKNAIEIFTTNYDVLIERSLEHMRVPLFDGFSGSYNPFFIPEIFDTESSLPSKDWVRLWKLHGSVNWTIRDTPNGKLITRSSTNKSGDMIFPSHLKYEESRKLPYQALMDHFTNTLNHDGSVLLTCGYSFSDQHINSIIFDALDNNPLSHVFSLQYGNLNIDDDLIKEAIDRPNLIVLCRNSAVIRGQWGEWKLESPIDQKTYSFMDYAFDSDAVPEEDQLSLTGELRLGEFYYFCKFLSCMDSRMDIRDE